MWIIPVILSLTFVILLAIYIPPIYKKKKEERRINELPEEEKKIEIEKQRKRETIKKVIIISNNSEKSTGSAAGRAIVGGALFGLAGLVVGASTAKNKNYITFLVEYEDSHRETYNVEINSPLYKKLIEYIEI